VIAGIAGVADVAMVGVPNQIGDDRVVLVLVPQKDPPRGFNAQHPVIAKVRAALPGLVDAAVLPDLVLVTAVLPRAGRSGKLDRFGLGETVSQYLKSGH
jgi:acyl-CoA synthetase (AMP-forming)/AMP-acid ligase II